MVKLEENQHDIIAPIEQCFFNFIHTIEGFLVELANLPNISAKLKKNCGCQMVTHLSINHGLGCLT